MLTAANVQPSCYHCGSSIPEGSDFNAVIAAQQRQFCSHHCLHTAQWINDAGFGDFYRLREGRSSRPLPDNDKTNWDQENLQRHVVRKNKQGHSETSLLIVGIHCSGCVWLIERVLMQRPGVIAVHTNPITRRARITFDEDKIQLSAIITTLHQAGYAPRPLNTDTLDDARSVESRDLLKRLLVAGFAMMQVMTYAFVLYMGHFETLPHATKELFRWLGFLLATPVVFYSAAPFYHSAKRALLHRSLNMDVPITIAITAVYASSAYQSIAAQGEVYFESVTMLVFFLLVGRYLEMRARHHSMDNADALVHLTPAFAVRRQPDGSLEKVAVSELAKGDIVHIAEGAHVPADGELISAQTLLDESLLSGEITARRRVHKERIIAGSIVLEGPIEIRVTHTGQDTFLSTLTRLSTHAQTERPRFALASENVTARFVRRVLIFTTVTFFAWLWYDPSQAFTATVALLVVACPCALGLAAPAAMTRAIGVLARQNILVVNPNALEILTTIDGIVFDKTGTLTEPTLTTDNIDPHLLQLAASLAQESQHPLSQALVKANTLPLLAVQEVTSFPGLGLEGTVAGRRLRLGQPAFVVQENADAPANASLVLGEEGVLLSAFYMNEKIRADAAITLQTLNRMNIRCYILSGDSEQRVKRVAQQLGIEHWRARQMPADKLSYLQQLQSEGLRIVMVGDGSNDAPVLAGADVSIALTSGAELAQANADILLCSDRLSGLLAIQRIAHETKITLRQNQRWAFTYNTVAMPVAALGFIPPWLAAIFMSASSLLVVINALRIGRRSSMRQQLPLFPRKVPL